MPRRDCTNGIAVLFVAFTLTACHQPSDPPKQVTAAQVRQAPAAQSAPDTQRSPPAATRNLSVDESMGGHTLARHVGKTDADLVERLRREADISSASTYTDRETAETVVAAALAMGSRAFETWRAREGRRPNFTLRYSAHRVIGRSVHRGNTASVPCAYALVVLRWDERRDRSYVLTSYPEDRP